MKVKLPTSVFSKIGMKLVLPYLIVSFFTFVLLTGLIYYNYTVQTNTVQELQEEILSKTSHEISHYIEVIMDDMSLYRKDITCLDCNHEELAKHSRNLMDENPSIHEISIIDENGKEVNKFTRYISRNPSLKDVSREDRFRKALEGKYYISRVYISEYELPFIAISMPIIGESNAKIGVLSAEIDLSSMWDTVSKIKVRKTGYVYVVDEAGQLIAYKDITFVRQGPNISNIRGVKNFLSHAQKTETYTSFNNESVIGTWDIIDTTKWGVIVELPVMEVFQEMTPLFLVGGISIFLFVLFVVIFMVIIHRKLVRPIVSLKEGISSIKSGNWNYIIKDVPEDELGELAAAFNQMAINLKESRKKIEEYSKGLEKQVAERTKELEKAKKELESRLNETERFNRLSVGRELKMIELKKKIRGLEGRK